MKYETVEVPFKLWGNRAVLTSLQVQEKPWLLEFMARFPNCFERSCVIDGWIYYPDGAADCCPDDTAAKIDTRPANSC